MPLHAPIEEVRIKIARREWRIRAVRDQDALVASVETDDDLERFPYGLTLWSSAVGLAEDLSAGIEPLAGRTVLELGAGVGLPGLVACWLGARVIQTDRDPRALDLARENAASNRVPAPRRRLFDWRDGWVGPKFDYVIGADILYDRSLHGPLMAVLRSALGSDGKALFADPLRPQGMEFVDKAADEGWAVDMTGRRAAWAWDDREIAIFTLNPPASR